MKKLKAAIIGCGAIFPMHAYSIKMSEQAELAAVCDIKEERAANAAKEFGCGAYTDYQELLKEPEIDTVHICTPHYLHPIIAIEALQAGKHVLTEKPMALRAEDGQQMCLAAQENERALGVIFQNRFNAGSQLVRQELDSGRLGNVLGARAFVGWYRDETYYTSSDWKGTWDQEGGGVIINQAIHTMDLLRWFVGGKVEWVDVTMENRTHPSIEVEDMAEGLIQFDNGVLASFYAMNYNFDDEPVHIHLECENGTVRIDAERAHVQYKDGRELVAQRDTREFFTYGDGTKEYWGMSHVKQIRDYYNCLTTGQPLYVPCTEALETQKMICAIYQSGRNKEKVICK